MLVSNKRDIKILNRKIIIPTTPFLIEIKGGGFLNVNSNNVDSMQMLLSYFIHKNYVTLALFYIKKERVTDIEKLKKSLDNDNAVYRYRTILTLNINEYLTSGKIYMSNNTQIIELIHNKKIDSDRISYRDQKNSFNVLVDDNNKKIICKIISNRNKYSIEISGAKYDFNGIDSIVNLKKQLLDSALSFID